MGGSGTLGSRDCVPPVMKCLEVSLRFFKWLGYTTNNAAMKPKRGQISDYRCPVHGRGRTIVNGTCICCASAIRVASPRAAVSAWADPNRCLELAAPGPVGGGAASPLLNPGVRADALSLLRVTEK